MSTRDEMAAVSLCRLIAPAEITFDVTYATNSRSEEPFRTGERITMPGTLQVVMLTGLGVAFCNAVGPNGTSASASAAA